MQIADFGLSSTNPTETRVHGQTRLPIKWMSMETLLHGTYGKPSDVWSLGVLLWEIYANAAVPYGDLAAADVIHFVCAGKRLEPPADAPDAVAATMRDCWLAQPAQRPTMVQIVDRLKAV